MKSARNETRRDSPIAFLVAGITALFLAPRVAFLLTRPPFFDELFTKWISAMPLAGIVEALRVDSGPPLYYFVVHLVHAGTSGARLISLVAASCALGLLFWRREWTAAALLAAYPAAIFSAADGRAYACCALFAAHGCLALDRWSEGQSFRALLFAVLAFAAAGYMHDYGVLFFALPSVIGVLTRQRRLIGAGLVGSLACGLLFLPGFLLAASQPRGAMQWMQERSPLAPLSNLGFVARYPEALIPAVSPLLMAVALAVFLIAIARTGRSSRALRFAAMTVVPALTLVVLFLGGLRVYFPVRFEAVIAVPLMLWLALAIREWPLAPRRVLIGSMLLLGAGVAIHAVAGYRTGPPDPFRAATRMARHRLRATAPVVASGYLYLELVSEAGASWPAHVTPFPEEQGRHPGWRSRMSDEELRRQRDHFLEEKPNFIWIGEANAPELRVFTETCDAHVLYRSPYVVIARLVKRPGQS